MSVQRQVSTAPTSLPGGTDAEEAVHYGGGREEAGKELSFNMTPMIDIVFNMLVFFVVCSTFVEPEGWLQTRLPRSQGLSAGAVVPITPIKVRLLPGATDEDVQIQIDNFPQGIPSFDRLYEILLSMRQDSGDEVPVVLLAVGEVRWQHVIDAYNQAVRARCKNIQFGTS